MQTENHYTETDLGNVAPNPRGNFDSTAKYEYLDLVSMQGGSYLCIAELGQTITGIAPEAGKNTEHWQCVAIPGNMTPEYTDAYGKVVRLAREVEQDAAKVAEDKQSVTQMETNARQLKGQAEESARQAENSKDSAAGSAREAKKAEESARQAENNVRTQVNGFNTHVTEKTAEAIQAVATAKDNAIQAVERQETASVQEVKDQTGAYITEQKNLAKQELDDKANQFKLDVDAIKAEVTEEGQKQITSIQKATTTELTKITEKGTEQTELVTAEGNKQVQAVQTAAQEIIADREQIQKNKADIASLTQNKADAIVNTAKGEHIAVGDSSGHLLDNLRIFGKSEQVQTTGKNLFSVGMDKTQDVGNTYLYALKLKPSTKYTLSCDVENDIVASLYFMNTDTYANGVFKNKPRTTMTGEDGTVKIYVRYDEESGHGINLYQAVLNGLHYIQLEEGDTETSPEPYTGGKPAPFSDNTQEIVNGELTEIEIYGKNLISLLGKNTLFKATLIDAKTNTIKSDIVDDYYAAVIIMDNNVIKNILKHRGKKINFKYSASKKNNTVSSIVIFGERTNGKNTQEASSVNGETKCSMVIAENFIDVKKIELRLNRNFSQTFTDTETIYSNLMCWIGEEEIEFEPYKEPQTITLNPEQPLTKWDRLEKREGIWGIVRQGARKILDGTETWHKYEPFTAEDLYCYYIYGEFAEENKSSFCTHFKNVTGSWSDTIGKAGYYTDYTNAKTKYFVTDKITVEEFKVWLNEQKEAGTPVELVYKTEEETWEPLPEETQQALNTLHTNYPTTVVTNNADLDMELSYVANTKNYTDNKIKEAVSAQMQGLANLLSLMPLSTQAAMIEADTNNILDNMEVTKYE